jgi:hypothetical protein
MLWQNRLNYSGLSALVIATQAILTQRTSDGSLSGLHPMQPRFNRIEAGLPRTKVSLQLHTTHQLLNHRILNIITKHSDLK